MLTDILFLLKNYGATLLLFLILSFLLGLWLAYLAWRSLASRVTEKQAEYTRLADRVNALRDRRQNLGGPAFTPLARTFAAVDGGGIASAPVDPTAAERKRLEKLAKAEFPGEDVRIDPTLGVLYNSKPAQADDLGLIRGVGPTLEKKLNDNGVYRFKQLSNWSDDHLSGIANKIDTPRDRIQRDRWVPQAAELATLSAAEAAPTFRAPARVDHDAKVATDFVGEPVRVDEDLGIVYDQKPQFADDLSDINGITPEIADKLRGKGIHRFKQVASWSDANVASASENLAVPKEFIESEKWVLQARRNHIDTYRPSSTWGIARPGLADYQELIDEEFKDLDVEANGELGVLFRSRPTPVDDLKEITGIGKVLHSELNDLGIYRFKQVAHWSESTIKEVAQRLEIHPEYVYRDEWIPEARRLYLELEENAASAATSVAVAAIPGAVGGGVSDGLPSIGTGLSQGADSTSQAVGGVVGSAGNALTTGASATAGAVGSIFDGPSPFGQPAESATRNDPRLGVLYTARPATEDDLTQITGVGDLLASRLNDFGVYTYEQIANWTPEQCQEFATVLATFKDRIERDNWVGQARELLAQKQGLGS